PLRLRSELPAAGSTTGGSLGLCPPRLSATTPYRPTHAWPLGRSCNFCGHTASALRTRPVTRARCRRVAGAWHHGRSRSSCDHASSDVLSCLVKYVLNLLAVVRCCIRCFPTVSQRCIGFGRRASSLEWPRRICRRCLCLTSLDFSAKSVESD